MEKNLLITGGTGFFGKSLLRYFLSSDSLSDFNISVLSRNPQHFIESYPQLSSSSQINFIPGDIEKRDTLPWDRRFTHVLHAATESTIGPSLAPITRFNQIVNGTTNLLDLAVATGVSRFLLTSSGAIYGPQPAWLNSIPENWSGAPPLSSTQYSYSHAKRVAEYLCTLYSHQYGLETVVARCFAFVGRDLPLHVHFAIGNFIRDALNPHTDSINIKGDGTSLRSYLHQDDLANWLFALLEYGRPGHAYNVGSDQVVTISELADMVRVILAPMKQINTLGDPTLGSARSRYIPNIAKIRDHLGLSITVPLADSIARFRP